MVNIMGADQQQWYLLWWTESIRSPHVKGWNDRFTVIKFTVRMLKLHPQTVNLFSYISDSCLTDSMGIVDDIFIVSKA